MGIQKRLRAKYKNPICVTWEQKKDHSVMSHNISLNGIFVISRDPAPVGSKCSIKIFLTRELFFTIEGKVIRKDERGFAITFEKMSREAFIHLKNIVFYNSTDPYIFFEQCLKNPGFL